MGIWAWCGLRAELVTADNGSTAGTVTFWRARAARAALSAPPIGSIYTLALMCPVLRESQDSIDSGPVGHAAQ